MALSKELDYLFSPECVRFQSKKIFHRIVTGKGHFTYHEENWGEVVDLVEKTILENYPDLNIPFHARYVHFKAGKRDRLKEKEAVLNALDPMERARTLFDLVITSVLLDAGAGPDWKFIEADTKESFNRSEGLGVASFHMFFDKYFSTEGKLEASAEGLKTLTAKKLEEAFQVSATNPLVGVEGRLTLLKNLGTVVSQNSTVFKNSRPGFMVDYLIETYGCKIPVEKMLKTVLLNLGEIWPGRLSREGHNLGDVWQYPPFGDVGELDSLVPFHKLSQWLTYSLMQPLMEAGVEITHIDEMTGLPEYRNGGLFLDMKLIDLKDPEDWKKPHAPNSELIIEWRALTICLLDELALKLRAKMKLDPQKFPLVKVLEGGSWWAGRRAAKLRREDGGPPLNIISDGTVF